MNTNIFPFDTVMVTGGAGFIGSRVVPRLRARGVRVIVVDNGYVGLPLPMAAEDLLPVKADIRDAEAMAATFAAAKPDAILHLAAVHHIPTCEREPHLAFDVNVLGTQTLLDAATAAGVGHVVFASSGAVYRWDEGALREGVTDTGATDVYSITKLANEYQLAGWAERTGARTHIARLFNTIGSGDPNGHLIPDILAQLSTGEGNPTIKLGNTKPKRDYIYVDDTADGFVALLEGMLEGAAVEHFNLCTGHEMTVAELVATIADLMGVAVTIESDPSRFRKIDRLQQLGDPGKIAARRDWQPRWHARDALARIIADLGYELPTAAEAA
jgi:nucleoside-diphosphate-sugar epimerase